MADISEILAGIQQAAANAYDGGEETGALQREKGNPLLDFRVNDDFKVNFSDNKLHVTYTIEKPKERYYQEDVEADVEDAIEGLVKYLKKEYKKIVGKSISLKKVGKIEEDTEEISGLRVTVKGRGTYEIAGL